MYPLLLTPSIKDYLWGGTRLVTEFGYQTDKSIAAEAWVLSCHKDGACHVANGDMSGKTLEETLKLWGAAAMGSRAANFSRFPMLIKLIDARDRLSVQVHPGDEYARRVEGEYGKTEMWYVLDCQPDARLIYGFNRTLSKEEFRQRIQSNTLEEVLNSVPVKKGDVFFIPSGTLHAIGAGILIAEVQQNSDTTYRVSDYGRLGADGKPRALHIDKAVDVTRLHPAPVQQRQTTVQTIGGCRVRPLAGCAYFTAEEWQLEGERPVEFDNTFVSLLCLSGAATLVCGSTHLPLVKGTSLFVPAGMKAAIQGQAELLCSYI